MTLSSHWLKESDTNAKFMPTEEELAERVEQVRRSWFDPELRAELGLGPHKASGAEDLTDSED